MGTFCVAKDANYLHVDNEDFDQTAHVRMLIRIIVGCWSLFMFFFFFFFFVFCMW